MNEFIRRQLRTAYAIKESIYQNNDLIDLIKKISVGIITGYKEGHKILLAGNGGSAADAQHIAGELVSRFYFDRPGLAAMALTTDSSILTAIGNDYGYEKVFARQIEANGKSGDWFIGISTSGESKNIIEAFKSAKAKGMISVALTGEGGGSMKSIADYSVEVPSKETPRIQEAHILVGHIICSVVEEAIFGKGF